jgi:hypothetical protein
MTIPIFLLSRLVRDMQGLELSRKGVHSFDSSPLTQSLFFNDIHGPIYGWFGAYANFYPILTQLFRVLFQVWAMNPYNHTLRLRHGRFPGWMDAKELPSRKQWEWRFFVQPKRRKHDCDVSASLGTNNDMPAFQFASSV